MMKKTVFLFGLFLMIYGTVNVKAQIRIGGEALPDASAVLDLNLNDTAMATGGLLLPRVSLASNMDNTTFGYPLKRGLMVYNVNDDDFDRPKEGVYCYDGAKWVFAGEDNSVKFTMTSETKQVWLGRQGEFKKTLKATVISKPDVDPANVAYEWTVGDSVIQTLRPELSLNVGILSPDADLLRKANWYAAHKVILTVKYLGNETKQHIATVSVGPGAWVGEDRWLKVANTNLGALEDIPLSDQLWISTDSEDADHFGYLFQWGSTCYRTERIEDKNKQIEFDLSSSMFDMANGQIREGYDNVFIYGTGRAFSSDWRLYPDGFSSEEPPASWIWNSNAGPGQTLDPCHLKNKGWRVPTYEDWHDMLHNDNNRPVVKWGEVGRDGIIISVSGNNSFFLPETEYFMSHGGLTSAATNPYRFEIAYWLNSPERSYLKTSEHTTAVEHHAAAIFFTEGEALVDLSVLKERLFNKLFENTSLSLSKGHGINIRCVAD